MMLDIYTRDTEKKLPSTLQPVLVFRESFYYVLNHLQAFFFLARFIFMVGLGVLVQRTCFILICSCWLKKTIGY
jgi:hypothetical protein